MVKRSRQVDAYHSELEASSHKSETPKPNESKTEAKLSSNLKSETSKTDGKGVAPKEAKSPEGKNADFKDGTPSSTPAKKPPSLDDEFLMVDETDQKKGMSKIPSSSPSTPMTSGALADPPKSDVKIEKVSFGDLSTSGAETTPSGESLDFVLMNDADATADDPYAMAHYDKSSALQFLSDAISSSDKPSHPPERANEKVGDLVRSWTKEFVAVRKEMQHGSDEHYALYLARIQPSVHKTVTEAPSTLTMLSDSLSSSLLGGITWTAASTWKTCAQCGQFFDRLSRVHSCKVCQEALCARCAPRIISFDLKLIGVARPVHSNTSGTSSPTSTNTLIVPEADVVELAACKSCRQVIKRAARFRRWYQVKHGYS